MPGLLVFQVLSGCAGGPAPARGQCRAGATVPAGGPVPPPVPGQPATECHGLGVTESRAPAEGPGLARRSQWPGSLSNTWYMTNYRAVSDPALKRCELVTVTRTTLRFQMKS